jgi:hypothetical protein
MESYPGFTVRLLWFCSGTPATIARRQWSKKSREIRAASSPES